MEKLLDAIRLPDGVKRLPAADLKRLAVEIRELLIDTVLRTGGHLASNLGIVELTLALFITYDFPRDKIVWDVGHQSYVYKILSGRKDEFAGLRQAGGLSGFPKREESPFDSYNTGHSSTSISAALGIARARDLNGEKYRVVTVTGDGALTGGLCYEAMNDAGRSTNDLTVILNDNAMSISKNVGSISRHLNRIRTLPVYFSFRDDIHSSLNGAPLIGKPLASFISRLKSFIKYAIIPGVLFEEMGFRYIGPVDGHNIGELVKIFRGVAAMRGPVLVHVLTKKGMGYPSAESDPQKYHGISPDKFKTDPLKRLTPDPGKSDNSSGLAGFSQVFGRELKKIAGADTSITAITAAMAEGTGLLDFAAEFPKRFFDVGIAEQHALTLAAGMSLYGLKPVVALYSTFLQRAYDQALHDICLQNAHVVLAVDRAGVVGEDGETHQGLYDIAFLRHMPNITIMAPAYDEELSEMLRFALYEIKGPAALRYPKDVYTRSAISGKLKRLQSLNAAGDDGQLNGRLVSGCGELLLSGGDITIVAAGVMLDAALDAAGRLAASGYGVDLISARFIKPFDEEKIRLSVKKTGKLLVAEDGCAAGGFGGAIVERLTGISYTARLCGLPDAPVAQGKRESILKEYGLDNEGLFNAAMELLQPYGRKAETVKGGI